MDIEADVPRYVAAVDSRLPNWRMCFKEGNSD